MFGWQARRSSRLALVERAEFHSDDNRFARRGMTLPRLPITVWAWFLNSILSLLIFSVLLAGCAALLSDRLLGSQFFSVSSFLAAQPRNLVSQGSLPVLWQRLFWYFAQAEVYVAMLPCFGIITHLVSTFSRKPVWKERLVVLALCGVGLIGFCVWGLPHVRHRLEPLRSARFCGAGFVAGSACGVFTGKLARHSLGSAPSTHDRPAFSIGFISLFIAGGLSGIFLARHDLGSAAVSEDFVIGHFHLVMGVAATFAILAALFFWFPKLFGRRLNEPLGKVHFWTTFAGVYLIFMPMHWLGLLTQSRLLADAQRAALASAGASIRTLVTVATICTVSAQVLFVINFVQALVRRKFTQEEDNPWRATTLEWSVGSPAPESNFAVARPTVLSRGV